LATNALIKIIVLKSDKLIISEEAKNRCLTTTIRNLGNAKNKPQN